MPVGAVRDAWSVSVWPPGRTCSRPPRPRSREPASRIGRTAPGRSEVLWSWRASSIERAAKMRFVLPMVNGELKRGLVTWTASCKVVARSKQVLLKALSVFLSASS